MISIPTLPEGDSQSLTSSRVRGKQLRHSMLQAESSFRHVISGETGSKEKQLLGEELSR